jgi:hypothetical protein
MKYISTLILLLFFQIAYSQVSISAQGGLIQTKRNNMNGYGKVTFKPEMLKSFSLGYEFSKITLLFEYAQYGQNFKGERNYDESIVLLRTKYRDLGWVLNYRLPKYKFNIEPYVLFGFDYAELKGSSFKFEYLALPKYPLDCATGFRESFFFDMEYGLATGVGFHKKLFKKTYFAFESRFRVAFGEVNYGFFKTNFSKQMRVGISQKF